MNITKNGRDAPKWRNLEYPAVLSVILNGYFMKVKWSMVGITDGRGKLRGQVATKTLGGPTIRTLAIPTNRQTTAQMAQRGRIQTNSQAWGALTEAQRQTWIAAAPFYPKVKNGDVVTVRGNTLYTELNTNLMWSGNATIDEAPLPEEMPVVTLTDVTAAAGTPTFTIEASAMTVPMGFSLMVQATRPFPPGRYSATGPLTTVGKATLAMGSDAMITEYTANVGTLIEGWKVKVQTVLINNTTGQKSVPSIMIVTIAA